MLRTLVVLLLLHALLLQVTAEPAASTAAAAKPKKEKRKKAPKEEVDIFADDYEDEEEEELFPPPSWDEQQMMYEGFVKQDSDGDGEINREDFIEFLAMSLVEELYSHKGIKSEINSGTCAPPIWNEALLRAQLVVAGVPLRPGFVPWVLLRRMTNGSVVADCARHEKCALTCSRSPGHHAAVKVAGSPLPFVMPECWPPCPREEETLERCARAFANVGSVTNACREGRC